MRSRLFVLASLLTGACARPGLPPIPPPPAPFVRYPYVQDVTAGAAAVLWTTARRSRDTLVQWIPGGTDTARYVDEQATARHLVRLAGLPPDSRIAYRVQTGGRGFGPHEFQTAPRRGTGKTFGVLAIGDSGWGSEAQLQLVRQMERYSYEIALHVGDMAYEDGTDSAFTQRYFRVYRSILARIPLFPAAGNHDVRADSGRAFDEAFVLPGPAEAEGRRYYSFDWGIAHFVALDSNEEEDAISGLRENGVQYRWLERDLARAAADSATRWIIVYLHHPLYSAATGLSSHGSDRELRRSLGPLFDRYGVDVVLAGHDHDYERSHPIRGDSLAPDGAGTVYIVTGGGGARMAWRGVRRAWHTAVAAATHHFVYLQIGPEAIRGQAIDRNGESIDRFTIPATSGTSR